MALTRPATFKKINVKALVYQLDGVEREYPVYYFGKTIKYERPEVPSQDYRWVRDNPDD